MAYFGGSDDERANAPERARRVEAARDARGVLRRVEREHASLRALLDEVERALVRTRSDGEAALPRLRAMLGDLRITFEDHLAYEESELATLWRMRDGGRAKVVAMILDHNEQRRVMRELIEDVESDVLPLADVDARTTSLVAALRSDITVEDQALRGDWVDQVTEPSAGPVSEVRPR